MKIKLLAIILSAVVVVGGGTAAGVAIVNNTPENVAINAIVGAYEDFSKRAEFEPLINTFKQGSIDVSVDSIEVDGENYLEDGHIKGKLYFSEDALMIEDFEASYKDISLSLDLYASEEKLYIGESEVLDTMIGLVKGETADDFEDSIFAFGSGSDYELNEDVTKGISAILKVYDGLDTKGMKKDAEKILESYYKELYKIICEYADFESESDEIRLNGEKTKVRLITITIEAEDAADIIEDFYDFLCDDDQVVKFLDEYEDSFTPLFEISEDYDDSKSISELYEEWLEEAEESIDEMVAQAENSSDEELEIEIATRKLSSDLLKLTVTFDKETICSFDFGEKGVLKTDTISITSDSSTIVYEITENSSDEVEVSIKEDKSEIFSLSIDKKKDTFKATLHDDVVLKGDIETKGKTTTITLDKIIVNEETISTDITVIIKEKDKMPAPSDDFDRINDITEDDIETWVKNIKDLIASNEKEDFPAVDEDEDLWTDDY